MMLWLFLLFLLLLLLLVAVCHFDFEMRMCCTPQRRAFFRHLNCQKCSDTEAFCTFLLRNVLRVATLFNSSTSTSPSVFYTFHFEMCFAPQRRALFQLPKMLRTWSLSVHFDFDMCFAPQQRAIFQLSSGQMAPHAPHFSEPTFRPSGATKHWKNTVFRDFPTFSRTCIFFILTLSLLWSCSSLLFSDSSHLCFFICPYCRKFDF